METKLKKTIISLPDELWKKVKIQAIEEETTLSGLVVKALEMYFSEKEKEPMNALDSNRRPG